MGDSQHLRQTKADMTWAVKPHQSLTVMCLVCEMSRAWSNIWTTRDRELSVAGQTSSKISNRYGRMRPCTSGGSWSPPTSGCMMGERSAWVWSAARETTGSCWGLSEAKCSLGTSLKVENVGAVLMIWNIHVHVTSHSMTFPQISRKKNNTFLYWSQHSDSEEFCQYINRYTHCYWHWRCYVPLGIKRHESSIGTVLWCFVIMPLAKNWWQQNFSWDIRGE